MYYTLSWCDMKCDDDCREAVEAPRPLRIRMWLRRGAHRGPAYQPLLAEASDVEEGPSGGGNLPSPAILRPEEGKFDW